METVCCVATEGWGILETVVGMSTEGCFFLGGKLLRRAVWPPGGFWKLLLWECPPRRARAGGRFQTARRRRCCSSYLYRRQLPEMSFVRGSLLLIPHQPVAGGEVPRHGSTFRGVVVVWGRGRSTLSRGRGVEGTTQKIGQSPRTTTASTTCRSMLSSAVGPYGGGEKNCRSVWWWGAYLLFTRRN